MSAIQSLDRALNILEIISSEEEIGLTHISKKVALNKTTTYRLITALKDNGYVKQLKNRKYALTYKMFSLGNRNVQNFAFVTRAKRLITKLAIEVQQVIHLVIQDGTQILYIDKYTPQEKETIMKTSKIGKMAPMYCTAAGKAILAFKTEEEIQKIWNESEIKRYTARTITSYDTFFQDLKRIKKNGYSTEFEEYQLGIYCIGAPIYSLNGDIVGAISISVPISDTNVKTYYLEKLKACINDINSMIEE